MTVGSLIHTFIKEEKVALRQLLKFILGSWVDDQVANQNLQPPPSFEAHHQLANPDSEEPGTGNHRLQLWALLVVCERAADWSQAFPGGVSRAQMIDLRVLLAEATKHCRAGLQRRRSSAEDPQAASGAREEAEQNLMKLRHAWDKFCGVSSDCIAREMLRKEQLRAAEPQQQQAQEHRQQQQEQQLEDTKERFPQAAVPSAREEAREMARGRGVAKETPVLPHLWEELQERVCFGQQAEDRLLVHLRRLAGRAFLPNDPAWELSNCLAEVTEHQAAIRIERDILRDVEERLAQHDPSAALAAMRLQRLLYKLGQQISDSHKLDHLVDVLGSRGIPQLWSRFEEPFVDWAASVATHASGNTGTGAAVTLSSPAGGGVGVGDPEMASAPVPTAGDQNNSDNPVEGAKDHWIA